MQSVRLLEDRHPPAAVFLCSGSRLSSRDSSRDSNGGSNRGVRATIYELYLRSSEFVSHQAAKAIETEEGAFFMPLPKQQDVEHE